MATQRALTIPTKLGPFTVQQRPVPSSKEGHLLVKVRATGLNPLDWKVQELGLFFETYPVVLGNDVAGTVEQVGHGVKGWKIGDRVLYQGNLFDNDSQGFQEYAVIDAGLVAKIPDNVSFSAAATIPVGLATATFALWADSPLGLGLPSPLRGDKTPASGPAVVIGGGAVVGQFTIQALKASGFSPIITYASGKHTSLLKGFGATHVIDRTAVAIGSLHKAVQEITSEPIKVVYDAISTEETQNAAYDNVVAKDGTVVLVLPDAVKTKVEGKKILNVRGSAFFGPENREFGLKLYKQTTALLEAGIIVPLGFEELPGGLAGIPAGLQKIKSEKAGGKKLVALPQETAA